jgi:hypothetical protein
MTAARRNGKSFGVRGAAPVLALVLVLTLGAPARLGAQTTERIVIDRHTGLAIHGFDPVGYFTDAQPILGRPELELRFAGVVWRFRNAGNRAAFAASPDVYMPRFGGYDPVAVARGLATPGHPQLWTIAGARLYLFQSAESRDGLVNDQQRAIAAAVAKWPGVEHELIN